MSRDLPRCDQPAYLTTVKCNVGVKEKSTAMRSAIPPANAITSEFNPRSSQKGMRLIMFAGMRLVNMCTVQEISARPARLPAAVSTKPSVMNCRTILPGDAPSELRTAISFLRFSGPDYKRPATLTVAINSSNPAPVSSTSRDLTNIAHNRRWSERQPFRPDRGWYRDTAIQVAFSDRLHVGKRCFNRNVVSELCQTEQAVAASS